MCVWHMAKVEEKIIILCLNREPSEVLGHRSLIIYGANTHNEGWVTLHVLELALEEVTSITTIRCGLAIATRGKKLHK